MEGLTPLQPTHPLLRAISDITVVLKKVTENPAVTHTHTRTHIHIAFLFSSFNKGIYDCK